MTTDAGLQYLRGLSACEKEKDRLLLVSDHINDIIVNETQAASDDEFVTLAMCT